MNKNQPFFIALDVKLFSCSCLLKTQCAQVSVNLSKCFCTEKPYLQVYEVCIKCLHVEVNSTPDYFLYC